GGRNFTQRAFLGQHDLSFTLEGPLAGELAGSFDRFWRQQGGPPGAAPPEAEPCPVAVNAWARLVRTEPGEREIAATLYAAVDRARVRVVTENPYFSDRRLIARLIAAARRGVDVRAVLTLDGDHAVYNAANRVVANRLRAAGVRVYLYPGMTHVKALAVDGCWAYTGTANFDPLSMRRDRELGLALGDGPVVGELEAELLSDCRPEWELLAPLPLSPHDRAAAVLAELFL
ncbi:MAG TPA: phosphatidylserine/phosphatidylglycerophosphate/cardiolipin synthase family protein, partial [Gemmataceae bacterium]|nr:phosphatidylserine/phosphatidylglycerophosphate/cardiolipin synthase family protein [Gemmataceae bacterium]